MVALSRTVRERMVGLHETAAKEAKLYNFSVAVRAHMGNGVAAMWVPVTPGVDGGRPSIYDLPVGGEPTLMGTYVTAQQCVHEFMSRPSEDRYSVRQVSTAGTVVLEASGDLTVINAEIGYGRIAWDPPETLARVPGTDLGGAVDAVPVHVWVGYSMIKVDVG